MPKRLSKLSTFAAWAVSALALATAACASDPDVRVVEGAPKPAARAALDLIRDAYNAKAPDRAFAAFSDEMADAFPLDALRETFAEGWREDGGVVELRNHAALRAEGHDGVWALVDFEKGDTAEVTLFVNADGRIAYFDVDD